MYKYEELTVTEVKDLLRKWRENSERKSEDVVELWEALLEDANHTKLGNERYLILEQVILAGLDCHRIDIVDSCIHQLSQEFPDSLRVKLYQVMKLEAMERYDEALQLIETIIKCDETNAGPRKRKIALLKATSTLDAIDELADYLKKFMCDIEAWQELCGLYLQMGNYNKAVFCAEELLLHQPQNHLFHQRVADIRYTMGGFENIELAKTYYLQSLKCCPDNLRALYGLYLVNNNLLSHYKTSANASKRKELFRLSQWALEQITAKYKDAGPGPIAKSGNKGIDAIEGLVAALTVN